MEEEGEQIVFVSELEEVGNETRFSGEGKYLGIPLREEIERMGLDDDSVVHVEYGEEEGMDGEEIEFLHYSEADVDSGKGRYDYNIQSRSGRRFKYILGLGTEFYEGNPDSPFYGFEDGDKVTVVYDLAEEGIHVYDEDDFDRKDFDANLLIRASPALYPMVAAQSSSVVFQDRYKDSYFPVEGSRDLAKYQSDDSISEKFDFAVDEVFLTPVSGSAVETVSRELFDEPVYSGAEINGSGVFEQVLAQFGRSAGYIRVWWDPFGSDWKEPDDEMLLVSYAYQRSDEPFPFRLPRQGSFRIEVYSMVPSGRNSGDGHVIAKDSDSDLFLSGSTWLSYSQERRLPEVYHIEDGWYSEYPGFSGGKDWRPEGFDEGGVEVLIPSYPVSLANPELDSRAFIPHQG